eukprot:TRINITY_DN14421_c0_g1_i1.p3 TRINITY_DN14421_c0_g1~~TRINITY_DN14421_c0_g1_i1.p3  ORF type:complete len:189 (+),score=34.79 TRINITY_DN14421_c0_g1_i1:2-568(+)
MWSVGCIVFELLTGRPLFDMCCSDEFVNHRHLEEMTRLLGAPPKKMWMNGGNSGQYYSSKGKLLRRSSQYPVLERGVLDNMLKEVYGGVFGVVGSEIAVDFIKRCLHWDPSKRISAKEALMHPFITGLIYQNYYEYSGCESSYSKYLGCGVKSSYYCGGHHHWAQLPQQQQTIIYSGWQQQPQQFYKM